MIQGESDSFKADSGKFLEQNEERFALITEFQKLLNDITKEIYPEIIIFIQKFSNVFFKDHSSTIFFFLNVIRFAKINFKKFEIILDLILHFSAEIKNNNVTELELLKICMYFPNSINYLFTNNFFSIISIIEHSTQLPIFFIKFYPEIEQYDPEYSKIREEKIISDDQNPNNQQRITFFNFVKANPEKHIEYRNMNYHPSPLHKFIREDDIDSFQSFLSKNNISVNHKFEFSFYERAKSMDKEISLIQVAAIYGSLNIFKFLWMQENIILNDNLLNYAYFGYNFEIIHLCEMKCQNVDVCLQPIFLHRNELFEYYIENFESQIFEKNDEIKNALENYDGNDDFLYSNLNSECLKMAVFSFNFPIVIPCLQKIIFIAKNVENVNNVKNAQKSSFLMCSIFELSLFEFIFNQKKEDVNDIECGCYYNTLYICIENSANEAFKFLFFKLKEKLNLPLLFQKCIEKNHDLANFILNLQIQEKESNDGHSNLFNSLNKKIRIKHFLLALEYYNEDIVTKMIMLYEIINKNNNLKKFYSSLPNYLSTRMINSLFNRLFTFLPKTLLIQIASIFVNTNNKTIADFINKYLDDC